MNLKKQATNGIKWTFLSTSIKTILQIVQLIILARFLSAEDFGLVAIVMVVIGFSQLFMDMGISNAIIHKQHITEIQLSSLYWLNIFSGFVISSIVFLMAPMVSSFYNEIAITPLLQLLSLSFFISAIGNQYRVLFRKELKFKILAKIEIGAILSSFIFAIILAMEGFGAYSLIYATLINVTILNSILLIIGLKLHKPKIIYQYKEIKSFLSFGLYQMGQNSIVYFSSQFDVILIGKLLGTEALGIYSLTKQLVMRPAQIINPIIINVSFPVMSRVQDNLFKLKSIYLKIVNYLSFVNFPLYFLMVILADSLVALVLGSKWEGAVLTFQILSIYAMIRSIVSPSGSLLLARGRADLGFYWSIAGFIFMPITIYIGSDWGLNGVAVSLLLYQVIFLLPNWYFIIYKICKATFIEYFIIIIKSLFISLLSLALTYGLLYNLKLFYLYNILIWTFVFSVLYLFFSYWFNKDFFIEIKTLKVGNNNDKKEV